MQMIDSIDSLRILQNETLNTGEASSDHPISAKVAIMLGLLIINFFLGILPVLMKINLAKYKSLVSYLNVFGASIALATGIIYFLPHGSNSISLYLKSRKSELPDILKAIDWCYFITFFAYSFILLINKVVFDYSIGGTSGHGHSHGHGHQHGDEKKNALVEEPDDDDDEEEEAFKSVVGTKGRFSTFMHINNLKERGKSMAVTGGSMVRASIILSKSFRANSISQQDKDLLVNPKRYSIGQADNEKPKPVEVNEINKDQLPHTHQHGTEDKDKSAPVITGYYYLMVGLLSFHGFFEGFAIGCQDTNLEVMCIGIFVSIHKIVESINLGLVFYQAKVDNISFVRMIILFCIFCPFGILVGLLVDFNNLIQGIFFGICTGCLMYVSASEAISEEFAMGTNRWSKFGVFLLGAALVAGVTCAIA